MRSARSVKRSADNFTNAFGTWTYIIIQTVIILVWIAANVVGFIYQWDAYPFILLNLGFSAQASYAAPLIGGCARRIARRIATFALPDAACRGGTSVPAARGQRVLHDQRAAGVVSPRRSGSARRLLAAQAIRVPDDVFYLRCDELINALRALGSYADLVVDRRAAMRAAEAFDAPASYGVEPPQPPLDILPPRCGRQWKR